MAPNEKDVSAKALLDVLERLGHAKQGLYL
jgi:hypothetical protein